jgi:hypothetical protein
MDEDIETPDWVELRTFEDGHLAHDVATAVLSMEFPAMLLDRSSGRIVLGVGSEEDDGESPQAAEPFVLTPSGRLPLSSLRSIAPTHDYIPTESVAETSRRRTTGGPWSLLVHSESSGDLESVMDELVEEQVAFEERVAVKSLRNRRINIAVILVVVVAILGYGLILLLQRLGVSFS